MNFEKVIEQIKARVPFLPEEFELFEEKMVFKELKKNEVWESEGHIGKYMGFVNKGILRQYYVKDGEEFTDLFFSEGEFIGNYISYMQQAPSKTSIEALEDCELLVLTFDELNKLCEQIPNAAQFNAMIGEEKLIALYNNNSSRLMDTPEERYQKLMSEKPEILTRVKQYYIAQYLGIRPESLSRIRKRKK